MRLCDYCNERPAKYKFLNGMYCCEPTTGACPAKRLNNKKIMDEKYKYSTAPIMRKVAEAGLMPCRYCGEPAHFYLGFSYPVQEHFFCCHEKSRSCPGHSKYLSVLHKKKYKDKPELKENMKVLMKEAQNRPEVAEKKQATMLRLHHEDCTVCKIFRKNFKKAHEKRRTEKYELNKMYMDRHQEKKEEDLICD